MTRSALILLALASVSATSTAAQQPPAEPKHFVYFGRDRERIADSAFVHTAAIAGAQLRYTWKELEPARGRYALQPVLDDVERLRRHGKRLWIQIQDVSFSETVPVPDYLRTPEFGGGADRKMESDERAPSGVRFGGWAARRWDPRVRARFAALLDTLGRAVDGRIEGINLAETAIGFDDPRSRPPGFTDESYAAGIRELVTAARRAFPRSRVIVYGNFMPGDPDPSTGEPRFLRSVYAHAESIGVGIGGPDLLPHRRWQQRNSLPLIAARSRGTVAGVAVQDGNLADVNPATGGRVTVEELHRYAVERLRLDYVFWGTQEPYYSSEVLPFLRSLPRGATP